MSFATILSNIAWMQTGEYCEENLQVRPETPQEMQIRSRGGDEHYSKVADAFISLIEGNIHEAVEQARTAAAAAEKLKECLLRTTSESKQIRKITFIAEILRKPHLDEHQLQQAYQLMKQPIHPPGDLKGSGFVHQLIESNPPNLENLLQQLYLEGVNLDTSFKGETPINVAIRHHNPAACVALLGFGVMITIDALSKATKEDIAFIKSYFERLPPNDPYAWLSKFEYLNPQTRKELYHLYFQNKLRLSEEEAQLLQQKMSSLVFLSSNSSDALDLQILQYGASKCQTYEDWDKYLDNLQSFGTQIQDKCGMTSEPFPEAKVVVNILQYFNWLRLDLDKHCEGMDRIAKAISEAANRKEHFTILGGEHQRSFMNFLLKAGHFESATFFINVGDPLQNVSSEVIAYCSCYPEGLTWLKDHGVDLTPKSGEPVIHTLLRLLSEGVIEDREALKRLADAGIDLNEWRGRTPLQLAVENGDAATVEVLLKLGVSVTEEDIAMILSKENIQLLRSAAEILRQRGIPFDYVQGLKYVTFTDRTFTRDFYRFVFETALHLDRQSASVLQAKLFDLAAANPSFIDLDQAVMLYGMARFKTVEAWNAYLDRLVVSIPKVKGKSHNALWNIPHMQGFSEDEKEVVSVLDQLQPMLKGRYRLHTAIENIDRPLIEALLNLGADLTTYDLVQIFSKGDIQLVQSVVDIIRKRRIPFDFVQCLEYLKGEDNDPVNDPKYRQELYRLVLQVTLDLTPQSASLLQDRLVKLRSNIQYTAPINSPLYDLEFAVIRYGITRFKTLEEWNAYFDRLDVFVPQLKGKCHTALWSLPNVQGFTEEEKEASVVIQVLLHILSNMNKELGGRGDILEKISAQINTVSPQNFERLFTALQTSESLEDIDAAMARLAQREPSREEWKGMPPETLLHWLCFYRVFRSRNGLARCHEILKHRSDDSRLVLAALKTIEVIGIAYQPKHTSNKLVQLCLNLAKSSSSTEVKIQALKSLRVYDSNPDNAEVKQFIGQELARTPRDKNYALAILRVLENYTSSDSLQDREITALLLQLLKDPDRDIRYQTALTLMGEWKIKEGLLNAMEIIKSHDWQKHDADYGKDQISVTGHYLTYRTRPTHLHDNRHAQLMRVQNRLVDMLWNDSAFQKEVQTRYEAYLKNPQTNSELERLKKEFGDISLRNTRYIHLPIFYPPNGIIMRGLAPRDGIDIWGESVRDLIRAGCWKSDLTTTPSPLIGTWCKLGHIFATHNERLIGQQYFPGTNSVLIIIAGDAYNQAQLRNQARHEHENTLNTVFYQGVPRSQIQHWYIDKDYLGDLTLLADAKGPPLADIKKQFTSPLFRNSSPQELSQMRRNLRAKDRVFCEGKWVDKSMFERCRAYKGPDAKEFARDGLYRINDQAVLEETLKRAIGRQILKEQFADSTLLLGQDEMLEVDDTTFRSHLSQFLKMLPFEISQETRQALLDLKTDGMPHPAYMRRTVLFENHPELLAFAERNPLYFG